MVSLRKVNYKSNYIGVITLWNEDERLTREEKVSNELFVHHF